MSLLAASRQLGSAMKLWPPGKQLKVVSLLHQCLDNSQDLSVQRTLSGIRHYSHPTHTDSEDAGEIAWETRGSSKTTTTQKSSRFQKKLHSRVISEQELADDREFLNQSVMSENEEDMFGTLQRKGDAKKMSSHSSRLNFRSNLQNKKLSPSDLYTSPDKMGSQSDVDSADERSAFIKRRNDKLFTQRVRPKQQSQRWSDQLGSLGEDTLADRIEESLSTAVGSHEERFSDDEDEQESLHIRLSGVNRRRIPEWYGRRILKLGKKGQIREALEVFEDWMLKQDRVMPNSYVFTCLITVLGRAGYTKKAFSLFRKMRSMGIQPNPATYTALFNACANSPWKSDGQTRADGLLRLMKEKGVEPSFITGKAMVKAFAMCGDLRRAFSLVDELSRVYRPDPEIFSFLLMACISDREAGLRHAIQVWRLMQQMGVQPDPPLYNLLLRCVRDCGVGDLTSFTSLITGGAATTTTTSQLDAGSEQQSASFLSGARTDCDILKVEALEQAADSTSASAPQTIPLHADVETDHNILDIQAVEQATAFPSASANHEQISSEPDAEKLGRQKQPAENDSFRSQVTEVSSQQGAQSNSQFTAEEIGEQTGIDSQQDVVGSLQSPSSLSLRSSVAVPDVLSPSHQHDFRIVSLGDLSTKEKRLLLLGGGEGVLSRMARDGAIPDIITFTQLISVAMPTVKAEQQLLDTMRVMRVKPDVDLVNTLIHRRCMRADLAAAKAARGLISEFGLTANQMTYGVLAMTCKSQKEAAQLLEDMEAADMAPNMEILGTLVYASGMKFGYKLWVLRQTQRLSLPPNDKFLHNVENGLAIVRRKMVQAEKQGQTDSHLLSPGFQQSVETFTQHYESWLKQTQVQFPRHPWASFRPRAPSTDHRDTDSM